MQNFISVTLQIFYLSFQTNTKTILISLVFDNLILSPLNANIAAYTQVVQLLMPISKPA